MPIRTCLVTIVKSATQLMETIGTVLSALLVQLSVKPHVNTIRESVMRMKLFVLRLSTTQVDTAKSAL